MFIRIDWLQLLQWQRGWTNMPWWPGDDPDDFYVSLKRLSPTDCLEMNETPERIQAQARGEMVQVEDKITREIYITYRPIVAGGDVES
jgi:hypothetical protein